MKHIFVGNGSISKRHQANLRLIRPDAEIVTVDINGEADYTIADASVVSGNIVYLCTPFDLHYLQLAEVVMDGAVAVFVEKPLFQPGISFTGRTDIPLALGYNYRFHPLFLSLKSRSQDIAYLHLYGSEDLAPKYGPTAMGTMASHSIDLALWILGDVEHAQVIDIGTLSLIGIRHKSKAGSHICASMLSPFRVATCTVLYAPQSDIDTLYRGEIPSSPPVQEHYFVERDDYMYIDEMAAWLHYVDTGDPGNLCTLDQALKVQEVMRVNTKANK